MNNRLGFLGVVVVALTATGCAFGGAGPGDKAGSDTIVLRLATVDGQVDSNGYQHGPDTFVRALTEVSGGRIQVEVETTYGDGQRSGETRLVEAIARGDVDGGWPSSRAFAGAGIHGLAALEAPLTITSYDAQRALAGGPGADLVIAALDGSGLRGLGLAVGPLRRPFGVEDFPVSRAGWAGLRFRTYDSPVQLATIGALGAQGAPGGMDWTAEARSGQLGGLEFDVAQYDANGFGPQADKVVSNVVLWPKMFVIALGQEVWDGLTDQQRSWVQAAAARAVRASIEGDYPEDDIASDLCVRGVRFEKAAPEDLLDLRDAVRPVIDGLARDPAEAPLLREVQAAAQVHPGPDAITVPPSCTGGPGPSTDVTVPTTVAPVPEGSYRKQISEADVSAAGLSNNDGTSGTWTLTVSDGKWYVRCRPLEAPGLDCGRSIDDGVLDAGTFYGDERVAWMVSDPAVLALATGCRLPANGSEGHCWPPSPPTRLEWSLDGTNLVFRAPGLSLGFEMVLEPFVRID